MILYVYTLRRNFVASDLHRNLFVMYQKRRMRGEVGKVMIVENLETHEFSVFLTTDPYNIKTSKDLKEAIINLILSLKYTNRDTSVS